ncbi:MAG: tRNA pseudouridine(13) synthase TruD [Thermoplasmata archaeon]
MAKFSEIGINSYYYDLDYCGGKLRYTPEDFYVEEIFENIIEKDDGNVLVLKLKVKNWEHNRLIRYIARSLGVSPKQVFFAGTKDKRALKVQYLSIPGAKYRDFQLEDVAILKYFYLDKPLTMGSHSGNFFRVIVKNTLSETFARNCNAVSAGSVFPNFYGPQRFGSMRPVTHLVGRAMVRNDFEEAARIFIGYPGDDRFKDEREKYYNNPDPSSNYESFPDALDLEKKVMKHLIENEGDFVGAIKELPQNLVEMFIHAYQGYLFNLILSKRLEYSKNIEIGDVLIYNGRLIKATEINIEKMRRNFISEKISPTGLVIGYESEFAGGIMGEIEREVISNEGIHEFEFKLPFGMKSRGERRPIFSFPSNMKCLENSVEFTLKPGAYGTSLLREIMRSEEMGDY